MPRKQTPWKKFQKNKELLSLVTPGIVYLFVFAYLPMAGLVIAFKNFNYIDGLFRSPWIGFDNFKFFFASEQAWRVTRNTVLYELSYTLLQTVLAITFAILLNEISKRWMKMHQTVLFLPYFLSWVVVGYIVLGFLDVKNGYLNQVLGWFGQEPIKYYMTAEPWPYILNAVALWKRVGFAVLIYYAGIMSINQEYYEAARIDGAGKLQMAWRITVPQLMPLIIILLILAIGGMFNGDFGLHYFVPNNSGMTYPTTDIIDTYTFRALLKLGDIGMSAAVGFYQSIVGLVLVVSANYAVKKLNDENALW